MIRLLPETTIRNAAIPAGEQDEPRSAQEYEMTNENVISELAAEITVSLLSIAPGTGTIIDLLPNTSKKVICKLFGAKQAGTLKSLIETTLHSITKRILSQRNAKRGTHEYGATFQGIEDFKASLRATRLDTKLLIQALTDPSVLRSLLFDNTPEEHQKWASDLRRETYSDILDEFTIAIINLAPQVPVVQAAIAVETLRQLQALRAELETNRTAS